MILNTDDDDVTSLPGRPEMLSKFEKLRRRSAPVLDAVPSDTSELKSFDMLPCYYVKLFFCLK